MSTRTPRVIALGIGGLALVFAMTWMAFGPTAAAAAVGTGVAMSLMTQAVLLIARRGDHAPKP